MFVILSGGGDDTLEVDADADVDVDIDGSMDFSADDAPLDLGAEEANFLQGLAWLGIGRTPLILLLAIDLTLWGFLGWLLNVCLGDVMNRSPVGLLAVGVFLGSLVFALGLGSALSRPIGQIFAAFGEDATGDRLVGCLGTVSSAFVPFENSGKIGQVDVKDAAANLVTISAKLPNWATITLRRGAKVLVIERLGPYYLVIAQDSPDQAQWMRNQLAP